MIHTPSETIIYKTKDYGRFKFKGGNRDIVQRKVDKIVASIKKGNNFLPFFPTCVNEDMEFLDGQHRFGASVATKDYVYYTINTENPSIEKVADINCNTDKWTASDFINCYVDLKNNHYTQLQEFMLKYKMPVTTAMMLLSGVDKRVDCRNDGELFRNGQFKVINYDSASNIADICVSFEPYFTDYRDRNFVIAVIKLLAGGKYQHNEMLKRLQKHNQIITKQVSFKEYLVHLETLYNFRNQKRTTLY